MPIATKDHRTRISIKALHLDFINPRELNFPAIVTEFKDNFDTKWKEEEVYGRMDPVPTFSGTGRKLNIGFRIINEDADIAKTNLGYLSNLIQYLYPKYKETSPDNLLAPSVLQSPPFFEIKFMNVIASGLTTGLGLRGYINSFSHTTPFGTKDSMQIFDGHLLLFSDIQVNIGFTVLHEKKIGWYSGPLSNESDNQGTNYPYNIPSGEISNNIIDTVSEEYDMNFSDQQSQTIDIRQSKDTLATTTSLSLQMFGGNK